MKIILVGGGKVGTALARQLSEEGHSVTVIDTNKARVEQIVQSYDVLGVVGNGSSIATLSEAGIEDNDVFIAITGSDELNLLCCMFAKKAGSRHTIARVRNPSYRPRDGRRHRNFPSAPVPRRHQDRHLRRRAGAADQVCPHHRPWAGRDAHP